MNEDSFGVNTTIPGVWFGTRHSYRDYGLFLAERPDMGSPAPKTVSVDIPGANGVLDYTEAAAGYVKYENRECKLVFSKMVPAKQQQEFLALLRNELHGKTLEIELDEDPGWIYTGRATVEIDEAVDWKMKVAVYVSAYPFSLSKTYRHEDIDVPHDAYNSAGVPLVPKQSPVGVTNTYFRFTQGRQQTADFRKTPNIDLSWKKERTPYRTGTVYIKDTTHDAIGKSLTVDDESATIALFSSPFTDLDKEHIAKMTVMNIPNCDARLSLPLPSRATHIHIGAMPVCPLIRQSSTNGIVLVLNNTVVQITSGSYESEDLMLWPGDNVVGVFYIGTIGNETDLANNYCEMIFREGRL